MPIECDLCMTTVGQEEFHAIDETVMRHAFDIHNSLGRFCDEAIYQDELAHRCRESGLEAVREARIRAIHRNFEKSYYIDLLVQGSAIYELKAVERLNGSHQRQAINYILLGGVSHGKLINFRPPSVEYRFVSTTLNTETRKIAQTIESEWTEEDNGSRMLRATLMEVLDDWGCYLDINLYKEALHFFMEQAGGVPQSVSIRVGNRTVGTQKLSLIDGSTAWHLSSVQKQIEGYETHLTRLLAHTNLSRIQWVNLTHNTATLKSLNK